MPSIRNVGGQVRYNIERLDGGLNTKASPSKISPYESPDCLNVVFDDDGAVATRGGSIKFNTTAIGSYSIDYATRFNGMKVAVAGGALWYASSPSATTFTKVTTSSGKFSTGVAAAGVAYQDLLFLSDGTNGPWKWSSGESFYNMGIIIGNGGMAVSVTCSPTGIFSTTNSHAFAYKYVMAYVNSQGVEGEIDRISSAEGYNPGSYTFSMTVYSIPVGSSLAGVDKRYIYRAIYDLGTGSGTGIHSVPDNQFGLVKILNDNTTTTFSDTTPPGAEGKGPVVDGTSPTAFKTVALHKDRLFFDDADNRSLLRYTEFQNPFISEAESFEPIDNGDGEDIIAIASQDDVVVAFKENKAQGIITQDPSDDLTWSKQEIAANLGIIGPKAVTRFQNGLVFVGRQNNKLTGFHFLNGLAVIDTNDGRLRSTSISERIEPDLFTDLDPDYWENAALFNFENRLYSAFTYDGSTTNNRMFWLDLNRVGQSGQPGSWSRWDGINANSFFSDGSDLYSCDSTATGFIRKLNQADYNDDGEAINSYFWTKQIGGEEDGSLDAYIKDLRELYIWRGMLGNYNMSVYYRVDGGGSGTSFDLPLANSTSLWGSMSWGSGYWSDLSTEQETRIPIGRVQGRRFQVGFSNQDTVDQGFKVNRVEIGMNIRRPR